MAKKIFHFFSKNNICIIFVKFIAHIYHCLSEQNYILCFMDCNLSAASGGTTLTQLHTNKLPGVPSGIFMCQT